jgi:hypothetical protein
VKSKGAVGNRSKKIYVDRRLAGSLGISGFAFNKGKPKTEKDRRHIFFGLLSESHPPFEQVDRSRIGLNL